MGNRAVITFYDGQQYSPFGLYLHWHGGAESVKAFAKAAEELGVRDATDPSYCCARLTQIVGEFFTGTLSVGIVAVDAENPYACHPGDNGVYAIEPGWKVSRVRPAGNRVPFRVGKADMDKYESIRNRCLAIFPKEREV